MGIMGGRMKNLIGFSTGAITDNISLEEKIKSLQELEIEAIEISCLRDIELLELFSIAPKIDLSTFKYVSFHLPSKFDIVNKNNLFNLVTHLIRDVYFKKFNYDFNLVYHHDINIDYEILKTYSKYLLIENLDIRKERTFNNQGFDDVLFDLPKSHFCLDTAHLISMRIWTDLKYDIKNNKENIITDLKRHIYSSRLKQIHVSNMDFKNVKHIPLSDEIEEIYSETLNEPIIKQRNIPLILETPLELKYINKEIEYLRYMIE